MASSPKDILPFLIILKEPEGVAQVCSVKTLFLEISQNSQENTCARVSFLTKLQAFDSDKNIQTFCKLKN